MNPRYIVYVYGLLGGEIHHLYIVKLATAKWIGSMIWRDQKRNGAFEGVEVYDSKRDRIVYRAGKTPGFHKDPKEVEASPVSE